MHTGQRAQDPGVSVMTITIAAWEILKSDIGADDAQSMVELGLIEIGGDN